ncbi:MAG TPA: YkvA family protein [Selenomonadales bacterium]|nr:YkvA family protein [Selenomonadales bacterium]
MRKGRRIPSSGRLKSLWLWAGKLKLEVLILFFALRHPATPWYVKLAAAAVMGYALSPVDLVPDLIPFMGYLDDAVVVPAGIALALRLMPPAVLDDCRRKAAALHKKLPLLWLAALAVILAGSALVFAAVRALSR